MGRSLAGAGEKNADLPLVTGGGPKQRRVRMGRAFQNTDAAADLTFAFGQ